MKNEGGNNKKGANITFGDNYIIMPKEWPKKWLEKRLCINFKIMTLIKGINLEIK